MQVQYDYSDNAALAASPYINERKATTPDHQINIFDGGWDDGPEYDDENDEDDYVPMAPAPPQRTNSATYSRSPAHSQLHSPARYFTGSKDSPSRISSLLQQTPSVVVLPASPHSSIASNKSHPNTSRVQSPVPSTDSSASDSSDSDDESNSDEDYAVFNDINKSNTNGNDKTPLGEEAKPRTSSRSSIPSSDVKLCTQPPAPPKRQASLAGQAARMYLQMHQTQNSRSQYDQSRSPSGLVRSSSRVGTRGVQGRISTKKSTVQADMARSRSVEGLNSNGQGSLPRTSSGSRIDEAKQKSRTLDRSLIGIQKLGIDSADLQDVDDISLDDDAKRQSNDGATVMKMISDRRRKSQSLDSKYLQYLDGISRHASAPNSPGRDTLEKKDKKTKKKSKKKSKRDTIDDEEEFQKYAETMATKTRTTLSESSPDTTSFNSNSLEKNLAAFVKEKAKADKLAKKKLNASGSLASKFSFKRSKPIGKDVSDSRTSTDFAESAQAFHELLQKENTISTNKDDMVSTNEADGAKTNSLKKEKRKSWRKKHGFSIKSRSKERLNSDPTKSGRSTSPSACDVDDSSETSKSSERLSRGPPQIKQTLGYNPTGSPSLRYNQVLDGDGSRERSTSADLDVTPAHSPKIMRPVSSRSKTLDTRKMVPNGGSMERTGSMGQLGSHPTLKHMNSLNSENSGSNSDISMVLDEDEYEELKMGKSGTLSRLLGRRMKSNKMEGGEFEDAEAAFYSTGSLGRRKNKRGKYATLGSPAMALRARQATSREALLQPEILDPFELFFDRKKFIRGFRISVLDDEEEDDDIDFSSIGLAFESAHKNKYATITGVRSSSGRSTEHASLRKRVSDSNFETGRKRAEASPPIPRRNQSLPVDETTIQRVKLTKSKGFGSSGSRTAQKGPTGSSTHLAFGETLTENEVVIGSTEKQIPSPLRTRKLHVIEPLLEEPSSKILSAARTLYHHLLATQPDVLGFHSAEDEKENYGVYEHSVPEPDLSISYQDSFFGRDLVTWLVGEMPSTGPEAKDTPANTTEVRQNICGMIQALVEEGAISHVRREHHFQDTYLLYQFHETVTKLDEPCSRPVSVGSTFSTSTVCSDPISTTNSEANDSESQNEEKRLSRPSSLRSKNSAAEPWVPSVVDEQRLKDVLCYLQNVAPDAMFRMVLRKLPEDRTAEELMMIYEEILHIKALAHLSDSVKRELAGVLKFEFYRTGGKTLFSQGDEGRSWYIIIKGSVDVDIRGQGVVCTLHEGDDFGNLAIINDAPRAATIVLAEDNCQLLRVDKHDFVRILKDVEANTVRLKEHEKDVLILQKIHARSSSSNGRQDKFLNNNTKANQRLPVAATPTRHNHRYAISAGTPSKIVEHVVKSLRPWSTAKQSDEAMEDLILMYQVFMSTQDLCKDLMNLYQSEKSEQIDSTKSIKRKVVYFVVRWSHIANHIFYDQPAVGPFLKELKQAVADDGKIYPNLKEDLAQIYVSELTTSDSPSHRGWITVESTTIQRYPASDSTRAPHQAIKANEDVMLKVYNANGTYTTVKLPIISTVTEVIGAVAEKQGREAADLRLVQVQSDGDMYALPKNMTSAATSLGVNSRLFICTSGEKDDISPLDEQRTIPSNNSTVLDLVGTQEIAEHITQFDWELINSIHVMEFVHKVFGSHKFHSVTSNIDVFARRFNQLAYWAPTEICTCNNVNKRVHLLRKFIKIAQHLKELQNMNAFMAVMIGLGNQALSRLHGTWDKLPTKYKKMMTEFEAVLDPSRNHRAYRLHVAGLRPPIIPYLPLLMKDMTFQHEGNESTRNGLINFEKMHMMSNSIRGVIQAGSKRFEMGHAVISSKTFDDTRQYTRNFGVITDQKLLNTLSGKVETKR